MIASIFGGMQREGVFIGWWLLATVFVCGVGCGLGWAAIQLGARSRVWWHGRRAPIPFDDRRREQVLRGITSSDGGRL